MSYLAESAVLIGAVGTVLLVLAVVVYSQTRRRGALVAMLLIALVTGALLVVERRIETPREAVERTLYEIAAAVEADDVAAVLQFLAPGAVEVRRDAETLMPLVDVEKARIMGTPDIVVDLDANPRTATVRCQAMIDVTIRQSGTSGPYMDRVTIQLIVRDGRWLVESYTPAHDWRRELRR